MRRPSLPPLAVLLALSMTVAACGAGDPDDPAESAGPVQASPRARLRLSGRLEGRLEPCGCASGQVGGLARRSFRLQRDRDSYDFLIEGGDLVIDGSPLDELKLLTILNVLDDRRARYDAVGVGAGDLRLPPDLFAAYVESFSRLPFVCADLVVQGDGGWPVRAFVDLERGDVRIRVTGFARAPPAASDGDGLRFALLDQPAAWQRAMQGIDDDTLRVLLHHGTTADAHAAAALRPRPDLIVVVNPEQAEPPPEAKTVDGVPFVHPGVRGRFVLDLTLARIDGEPRVTRYHAFPLEGSRTANGALTDDDVAALVLAHRFDVREDGTRETMAERRPTAGAGSYVGNTRCASCHLPAHETWLGSGHALAWETLDKAQERGRYPWPVAHYPDCIACHCVGYGEESGFVNPDRTPDLAAVGCEACHGPGSEHSDAPEEEHMARIGPETCVRCHDFEQSPGFDYAERWKRIEHR